jgi:predicted amidophosphoribosyltransferase
MQAIRGCCRRCGAPFPHDVDACTECRGRRLAFERAWAPVAYTGPARRAVLALKGRDITAGTAFMAAAIVRGAPPGLLCGALVPAPAHPERMRRHGQNHSRTLAEALGRRTGLPVLEALGRRPGGLRQVGLERRARNLNARGWIVPRASFPPGGRAVLVDDVYTTGSTMDACAAALRTAGSGPVTAVCFARTARLEAAVALGPGAA